MKIKHVLPLSALLLVGCNSMQDMFGSNPAPRHDYNYSHRYDVNRHQVNNNAVNTSGASNTHRAAGSHAVSTSKGGVIKKKEVTATTLADPGDTAVVHPKTATAPAAVPLAAPSVAQ